MKMIEPKQRPHPFQSARTHANLNHDYATWDEAHVDKVSRKTSNKLPFEDKSKFDSAKIIDEAIKLSCQHPAQLANNGNHVVTFDMGYEVGFDAFANRRTSAVTVVLRPTGEVITAHPGTPWSKDQSRATNLT